MSDSETGQVSTDAAEVYDEFFLPALFDRWTGRVCDAAAVASGDHVIDVACGTGALAIAAAGRVGPDGMVVGLDINPGMLAQAQRKSDAVEWQQGGAEALPFADEGFDAAVSQFGLMFFEDRAEALAEMWRVLKPGGRMAVAVWAGLGETPGYNALAGLLDRLFGADAAGALHAPYCLGDREELAAIFRSAGIADVEIGRHHDVAEFPSIESWMFTDIRGWTLADMIDDAQYEQLLAAAKTELAEFLTDDGRVRFAHPALIATAAKPG